MNKELTAILKNRIEASGGVEFIDVYSGLVQTVTRTIADEDGNKKSQRFPVSYNNNLGAECGRSPEKALTPDSRKKGLVYFEESAPVSVGRQLSSGFINYKSSLLMVVWLNKKKINGETYSEISKTAIERLMSKITTPVSGEVGFINVKIKPDAIRQDAGIFGKYSYDEEITQFLRPPFEFFAIALTVSYYSKFRCAPAIELNPSNC